VASWRRNPESQNEEEFILRIALEMKHLSLGEEDNHLPEELLSRVANEMWMFRSTHSFIQQNSSTGFKGFIGMYRRIRSDFGVRWSSCLQK
jgi:flagellar biosynthesis regulator FlaF